ncbi:iron-containing alcohol dehydrogenase [Streptomyces sp. TM32]|uniref:daptide-type RiPP biosynthesis dehydogenase n=1 Tax=Streptomyces sp. TM32 TaxID=1652669 RepID=UPI0010109A87|nr:daptide-type RiPP biosynthesis dehydogenase [Streptomyces sp. TM32]RXS69399.1 iron-containing alcohol dehydrogenase [Streptomyces sp. TM32]
MIFDRWACRTEVRAGHGVTAAVLARLPLGRRPVLVVDEVLAERAHGVRRDLASLHVETVPSTWSGTDSVAALTERMAALRCTAVVGLGGGSTLDLVKLACLAAADPRTLPLLRARSPRSGLILLPSVPPSAPAPTGPLRVLVPTTVGTGAEASAVACLPSPQGKRLVSGEQLRPDIAVLDSAHTKTLPRELLAEGVLEALLRVVGSALGEEPGLPHADDAAVGLVVRLAEAGERLLNGDATAEVRLTTAWLSTTTHTGWALAGRPPYAAKHWYLANELSTVLGVRKMTATAAILPAVWQRIRDGDRRFGDARRLRIVWSWVRTTLPDLPIDPVEGITALVLRWRLETPSPTTAAVLDRATRRAVASWGGRLPMLGGVSHADIRSLFAQALCMPSPDWEPERLT